jgi:hypothetical protein
MDSRSKGAGEPNNMMRSTALALVLPLLPPTAPLAAQTPNRTYVSQVVTLATRPKVTVSYAAWQANPPADIHAAIVLLAGGNGALHIASSGSVTSLEWNFLVRSRELFLRAGVDFIAAVDAPSDRPAGMNGGFRLSQAHADDVAKVIDDVRARSGLPVWLVGTSTGTLSAANVAARLSGTLSDPDGIVLTSTMAQLDDRGYCGHTVFQAKLAAIRRPVLVVSHQNDACICTPAAKADAILKALALPGKREKKIFAGGLAPVSGPCEARAEHGYYGIEQAVTSFIATWIKHAP